MADTSRKTKSHMKKTLVFFLSAFLTSSLFAASGKLAKDLESLDPAANVDVIVQFKQAPTEANHQAVLRMGGKLKHEFATIKARHYSIPATALAQLAADPDVAYVTPDRTVPLTSIRLRPPSAQAQPRPMALRALELGSW